MKQALEHIVALVDRIGIRSSSLEVQSILQSIAQTARQALGKATVQSVGTASSIPQEEPRMFQGTAPTKNGGSPAVSDFRVISVPMTGKETGTSS